jgi:hypothetical protein
VGFGLGVLKEFFYDEVPSWFNDDIGWDNNDMRANQRGVDFGNEWRKYFNENYGLKKVETKAPENKKP